MANCADCGRNPKRGCLPSCTRDKTISVWARYRARKKAARVASVDIVDAGPTYCQCGQLPRHIRHANDGTPRVAPPETEAVEWGGPHA